MQELHEALKVVDGLIGGSGWFVYLLLGVGLFFTLYLGFPQIRYFGHALRIVRGKFDRKGDEGDTSHFQALSTALSGTVGTGNISGVAFALHLGGPAALFWMLVTAFIGMCTKFVEVTLSHKYREKTQDGTMAGGPMYYMRNANFTLGGKKVNLKWLAAIFAIATILSTFGTGNMPQINSIASAMHTTFNVNQMLLGAILSILLGVVIVGGIKRIAKVTERLVPSMALLYFIGVLAVIISNIDNLIPSVTSIFTDIFQGSSAVGGFLGASIAYAFNRGVNRGLFSNEAGQGSAPIAHASAKAHEPVSEGMVAILEPFIDTILICTLTGLAILSSGVWSEKHLNDFEYSEMEILQGSYDEGNAADGLYQHLNNRDTLPRFTGKILVDNGEILKGNNKEDGSATAVTVLHARSIGEEIKVLHLAEDGEKPYTGEIAVNRGMIKNNDTYLMRGKSLVHSAPLTSIAFKKSVLGDYGQYLVTIGLLLFAFSTSISWSYYGDRAITYLVGAKWVMPYRILYILAFFLASFTDTSIIWTFSGIAIALMTIPNLIGIFWLRKEMKSTVKDYWSDWSQDHGKKDDKEQPS